MKGIDNAALNLSATDLHNNFLENLCRREVSLIAAADINRTTSAANANASPNLPANNTNLPALAGHVRQRICVDSGRVYGAGDRVAKHVVNVVSGEGRSEAGAGKGSTS